jgi:hypothetical protein
LRSRGWRRGSTRANRRRALCDTTPRLTQMRRAQQGTNLPTMLSAPEG